MPDWYAIRDLTRQGTPVRLLLERGEVTGFLKVEKGIPQWWARRDSGAVDRLPVEPYAWRVLDSQPWPDKLPQPITLSTSGRFVDVRPRRVSAMARQAEEADRIRAQVLADLERDHGPAASALGPERPSKDRWWLDHTLISYSAPGSISITEVEGRVARALLVDGFKALERPSEHVTATGALTMMVAESYASGDLDGPPPFESQPRDHDDYEIAMGWFAAIAPLEIRPRWALGQPWHSAAQKVLAWRIKSPPDSWRRIASREGGSQEGWRRTWGGALEMVRRAANGEPVLLHATVADQLAALRERNLAWKRRDRNPVSVQVAALQALGGS